MTCKEWAYSNRAATVSWWRAQYSTPADTLVQAPAHVTQLLAGHTDAGRHAISAAYAYAAASAASVTLLNLSGCTSSQAPGSPAQVPALLR
jgi:hypothetical protein